MADTTDREIAQALKGELGPIIEEELLTYVIVIAENAVKVAREDHIYHALTGNLQSSVGFTITLDGTPVVGSDFAPKPGNVNPDGITGSQEGKAYMEQCLQEALDEGITLIMVAGMDYAGYVEDMDKDVLKSAEAYIRQEFDKLSRKWK